MGKLFCAMAHSSNKIKDFYIIIIIICKELKVNIHVIISIINVVFISHTFLLKIT